MVAMAGSGNSLNARNLRSLGAERLAELLIELSAGDAGARRRLRLALAASRGPAEAAREVRKRLAAIARSGSVVDGRRFRALSHDLDGLRTAITTLIAPEDPLSAVDLLWRFLDLAEGVLDRSEDGEGRVRSVFDKAVQDLGAVAEVAQVEPVALAEQAAEALEENGHGQLDGLIQALAPALGMVGLQHLRTCFLDASVQGPTADLALREIADALEDVDGYIAQFDALERRQPGIAAGIARRLLAVARPAEALAALEAAGPTAARRVEPEWEQRRIEALEALGRSEEAQECRWRCFARWLAPEPLRDHLARLPDFEDADAEERAFAIARSFPIALRGLNFLLEWPALRQAAALVLERHGELDGDAYERLNPAAERLAAEHPLAAALLLRAMVDFTLSRARGSRYSHAARHLRTCARLDDAIGDYGAFESHGCYLARLHEQHGGKDAFWGLLEQIPPG
jgi:hypothetical protein